MSRYAPRNDAQKWANDFLRGRSDDGTVPLRPAWARALGSISVALVLQQLLFESRHHADDRGGWFYVSVADMEEATTVGSRGYLEARKRLSELGLIESNRRATGARPHVRFVQDRVVAWVAEVESETPESVSRNARERFRKRPRAFLETPEGVSETPGSDSETPEGVSETPESVSLNRSTRVKREVSERSTASADAGSELAVPPVDESCPADDTNASPAGSDEGVAQGSAQGSDRPAGEPAPEPARRRRRPPGTGSVEGFPEFWAVYPWRDKPSGGRTKGNRAIAEDEWRRLGPEDRLAAMAALPAYIADRGDRPKDAERYLSNRLWRGYEGDEPFAREPASKSPPELRRIDAELIRIRTTPNVRYIGASGLEQKRQDIAALERQREALLASGTTAIGP